MRFDRAHARRIGFVLVVAAAVWLELSPWGVRASSAVLELQHSALDYWSSLGVAGDAADAGVDARVESGVDSGATSAAFEPRPLSRVMAVTLVVIGALVWWESRLLGWAIASSVAALVALLAVSTMMLPRGVQVPTVGPGFAIVAGMLGRRALEAIVEHRDRGRGVDRRRE